MANNYLKRKVLASLAVCASIALSSAVQANEETASETQTKATQKAEASAGGDKKAKPKVSADTLSTNIIGSEEAPTVVNVVPWKDRGNKMKQEDASVSVLSSVLQPLDRDIMLREIEYHQILKESGR